MACERFRSSPQERRRHQNSLVRGNHSIRAGIIALAFLAAAVPRALAQEQGPIAPPPKFETKSISPETNGGPPPIPLQTLLQQVAQHEDAIEREYSTYTFRQETRITEFPGAKDKGGEFSVVGEVYQKPEGARYERILKPPDTTLQQTAFSLADVEKLASIPLFILTARQLPNYNVSYEGEDKLDEIHTYILRVKPKQLEHNVERFDGVVWVDDHDMTVVKSYGRFVTDVAMDATLQEPFKDFEVYRENIVGHYWFPTYVDSDALIAMKDSEMHLKLVMRSTNFKPLSAVNSPASSQGSRPASSSPAPAGQTPANGAPANVSSQPAKP